MKKEQNRIYIAIDAFVECMERGLDILITNLLVTDASEPDKIICLAALPSLKAMGIKGRPWLFEVVQTVKKINYKWKLRLKGKSSPVFLMMRMN